MGAATGKQYKERLQKANNNVYVNGERVDDVTTHPAFKNVIDSMAKLYDIQHEKPEKMLYTSPTTGDKVGMTFLHPMTKEDLFKDRKSTRLNSSHVAISYAVFCLKKKKINRQRLWHRRFMCTT